MFTLLNFFSLNGSSFTNTLNPGTLFTFLLLNERPNEGIKNAPTGGGFSLITLLGILEGSREGGLLGSLDGMDGNLDGILDGGREGGLLGGCEGTERNPEETVEKAEAIPLAIADGVLGINDGGLDGTLDGTLEGIAEGNLEGNLLGTPEIIEGNLEGRAGNLEGNTEGNVKNLDGNSLTILLGNLLVSCLMPFAAF